MTTPERLRQRQRVLGVIALVLGLFTVAQAVFFTVEDNQQRDCFRRNFQELVKSLEARAEATDRETAATKKIWLTYADAAGLVREDPTQELPADVKARLQRQLVQDLLDYQKVIRDIERQRERNPVPPYPPGSCS